MLIKQESFTSRKPGSLGFWRITNSVLNKGKSVIPPLFDDPEVLSYASDKAKLFAENFSKNYNLDHSGISLPDFPSWCNVTLHNISVCPKMIRKVIVIIDLSKASGPDCIPISVWKSLVFQFVESFHRWFLYLRMLEKGLMLKTTALSPYFLWLVKSLEDL